MRRRFTYVPLRLPEVADRERLTLARELGVSTRDGDVVEEDVALG